jgi:hypothetical protein
MGDEKTMAHDHTCIYTELLLLFGCFRLLTDCKKAQHAWAPGFGMPRHPLKGRRKTILLQDTVEKGQCSTTSESNAKVPLASHLRPSKIDASATAQSTLLQRISVARTSHSSCSCEYISLRLSAGNDVRA